MPAPLSLCRRVFVAAVLGAVALVSVALVAAARPAAAAGDDAAYFVNAINNIRVSRGLAPLAVDEGQLTVVAAGWSTQMAAARAISHNPALATQVTSWRALGENVGTGGTVDSIEAAFENSPHHFENMVDPQFTQIGVAVLRDVSGTYWVTEDFKLPKGAAAPAPAPAPRAPAATAAPKAVSKPAPRPAPKPVAQPAAHAVATPTPALATATPSSVPVATTQPAPAPTVPVAVLGAATQQPHALAPAAATSGPFTTAHILGLVAAAAMGMAMAFYTRVRVTRTAPSALAG